jgi:hypothetical protein
MSPLQKRALYSFILGAILTITLIIVFLTKDVYTFDEDLSFRLIVYALWIAVPLVYLIAVHPILKKPDMFDERDRSIVERASKVQWIAIIFNLAAWTIILTEVFWDTGQVPVVFLNLIFISTLTISTLAQSLGIFIGYWKGVV